MSLSCYRSTVLELYADKILIAARTSLPGALNSVLRRYLGPNSLSVERQYATFFFFSHDNTRHILQSDAFADKSGEFGKVKLRV